MKKNISIEEVAKATGAEVLNRGTYDFVRWVVASGLMSDVLTTEKEEILLVTSLATPQVIRTADMVCAHAVLICCDKPVTDDVIKLAETLEQNLMVSRKPVFESCCDLKNLFFEE